MPRCPSSPETWVCSNRNAARNPLPCATKQYGQNAWTANVCNPTNQTAAPATSKAEGTSQLHALLCAAADAPLPRKQLAPRISE